MEDQILTFNLITYHIQDDHKSVFLLNPAVILLSRAHLADTKAAEDGLFLHHVV